MPFNLLLTNHLIHGTSFKESGVPLSIRPGKDETIILFHLDSDKNRHKFNKFFDFADTGETICDLLIYYFNHSHDESKKAICLVELKGIDTSHAVKQLSNTHEKISKKFMENGLFQDLKWGACIYSKSSVPKNMKSLLTPLSKKIKCKIITKDIHIFLRDL